MMLWDLKMYWKWRTAFKGIFSWNSLLIFAVFINAKLDFVLERTEEEGILHHLTLHGLENQLKTATEDFQSRLKQKNSMIQLEKQRNQDLELTVCYSFMLNLLLREI